MTAAVGGAAQSGPEILLQANSGRVSPRGQREQSNSSNDDKSKSDETKAPASRSRDDGADAKISRVEKRAIRRRDEDQSDDDDATFEDTFESVGKDALNETTQASARSQPLLPNLAMAQLLANAEKAQSVADDGNVSANSQNASRPAPVLKQASILALMNTRDRMLSSANGMPTDEVTPEQSFSESTDPTDRILATVDRRETHWNFSGKEMADAGAKASELQAGMSVTTQTNVLARAMTNAQKTSGPDTKATLDDPKTAQTTATSNADLPSLASGNSSGGADADRGDQGSQQSQKSINPDVSPRRIGKDDAASQLDRIFSTDPAGAQASASVTDQVRNGVVGSLTGAAAKASANAQQPDAPARPAANAVLRTLDLTLSPADLGTVKLHMSLKDNALSIEAEASKASTAKLLGDDRVNLEKGLRDAGYDLSSVKITDASASSSANPNNGQTNGSPSRDGEQARSNSSGRQDGEMQQRRDDGSSSDQAQRRAKDNRPQPVSADGPTGKNGNAVYI